MNTWRLPYLVHGLQNTIGSFWAEDSRKTECAIPAWVQNLPLYPTWLPTHLSVFSLFPMKYRWEDTILGMPVLLPCPSYPYRWSQATLHRSAHHCQVTQRGTWSAPPGSIACMESGVGTAVVSHWKTRSRARPCRQPKGRHQKRQHHISKTSEQSLDNLVVLFFSVRWKRDEKIS